MSSKDDRGPLDLERRIEEQDKYISEIKKDNLFIGQKEIKELDESLKQSIRNKKERKRNNDK